jgi:hypothetical protein
MDVQFSSVKSHTVERGFMAGIRRYWNARSIYAPFVCLVVFLLFGWFSGASYVTFGPNADLASQRMATGRFLPHPSISAPYRFKTSDGTILALNCKPRMRKSYCADMLSIPSSDISIYYAPYEHSAFNTYDGILTRIVIDGREAFTNRLLTNPKENQESATNLAYWEKRPFLIIAGLAPICVLLFICAGIYVSLLKMLSANLNVGDR